MKTFQQQPDELADLRRRLALCDQEREQLQTALEDAEHRLQMLEDENGCLQADKASLSSENGRLRHLLAEYHARFLEARVEVSRDKPRPATGVEGEIAVLSEELQVSVEELEEANAALRATNERLEQQVAERTASLAATLAERDGLLRRKDLLIREVDHRVKNSLQMVQSLLRIQTRKLTDPASRRVLQTAGMRIQAIAQVHAMLYARSDVETIAFADYLEEICISLDATLGVSEHRRALLVEAEPVALSPDLAIPLALITTELVSNAFRHAFGNRSGTVWVQCRHRSGGMLELTVADDGRGLPAGVDVLHGKGLGLQVVNAMAEQIGARLDISGKVGARFSVTVPLQ